MNACPEFEETVAEGCAIRRDVPHESIVLARLVPLVFHGDCGLFAGSEIRSRRLQNAVLAGFQSQPQDPHSLCNWALKVHLAGRLWGSHSGSELDTALEAAEGHISRLERL